MSSCSLQKICICRDAASSFVRLEDCVPSPASPIPALWQSCARPSQTPSVCTMSPKGGYTLRILRVRLYINCLASKLPARGQGVPTSAWLPGPGLRAVLYNQGLRALFCGDVHAGHACARAGIVPFTNQANTEISGHNKGSRLSQI
jgi:hypothetical protein